MDQGANNNWTSPFKKRQNNLDNVPETAGLLAQSLSACTMLVHFVRLGCLTLAQACLFIVLPIGGYF
jgi:hypothetical protein